MYLLCMTSESRRPTPPSSQEAEESVIGGILVHQKKFNDVAAILLPEDFYQPSLRSIYEAMMDLTLRSKPIDALTIQEQMKVLETFDNLRRLGGADYLVDLMTKVVTVENIAYHANIVREKATARKLADAGREITAQGYGEYGEIGDYLDSAQRAIFQIAQRSEHQNYQPIKKLLKAAIVSLEEACERKDAITGVPSGFPKIDEMTAGLQPSDLIIIAARPSMGKTSFVMNIVQNAALQQGVPALVFSLEMSSKSLIERMLCSEARLNSRQLRRGLLGTNDWIQLTKAASALAEAPIFIDDSGSPTLLEIRAKARRWRADNQIFGPGVRLGMVVIDYLQLIQGRATKEDNRQREISEISRGLKALAKELECPVVALSQLNRALEGRADKRPVLSDLRESGAIEQDADLIAFIYRDVVYSKDECKEEDKNVAEIIIGKQRSGPIGTVRLAFLGDYTRFENLRDD